VRPKASDTIVPREAPAKTVAPKVVYAPEPAAKTASGGQVLQLGAFSSESRARTAFKELTGRYGYLAGMEPQILPVASDGKTLYRLRTVAGSPSAAKDICGRLKVAGEACSVVN
jgi:cell division septation protein DedD